MVLVFFFSFLMDVHIYSNKEIPKRPVLNQWTKTTHPIVERNIRMIFKGSRNKLGNSVWDLFARKIIIQGMVYYKII